MHKSIIFLLGLLVVLMPIGTSMNIISNANAISESEYYTDQYIRYAEDLVNQYADEYPYTNDDDYGTEQDLQSYGNNNYDDSKYQSYKHDYIPKYLSYDKHDRDKSKKDNTSVSINKLNCINTNININGNNAGNISIGNKGATEEGYFGVSSFDGSGEYGSQGYHDGYNKKDKGFDCRIKNNNTNTNIVSVGGGNITDGNGGNVPEPQTCEECFRAFLTEDQIDLFLGSATLEDYCNAIESGNINETELRADLAGDAPMAAIDAVVECLQDLGILPL